MAKRNAIGFDTNKNADGFDIAGGTTSRKLTITGGNITFTNSGDRVYTLPSANETLAALGQTQTFSAKQTFGTDISVSGLAINTNSDGAVGSADFAFSITKNDSNTRSFSGLKLKPTLNTGGSNTNTTLNLLDIDTTNTAVTGLTTNLLKASYGGTQRLSLTSAGNLVMGSAALSTSATDGFFYLNSTAGVPTGIPTTNTGRVPINVDTTNGRMYGYFSSGWKNLSKDTYDVVMFGADPTGTNDSLSAFQAARDAAKNAGKGIIHIPPGTYKLSNTFQIGDGTSTTVSTYHGIRIVGSGGTRLTSTSFNDAVKIVWSGSAGGTVIKFAGPIGGCGIENVLIDCDNGANDAATAIFVSHAEGTIIRNVHILNNSGIAVDIDSFDTATFTGVSVFNSGNTGLVENLFINTVTNNASGVRLGANGNIAQWMFIGGRWRLDGTTGSTALTLSFADHNTFIGTTMAAEVGLRIKPTSAHVEYPHNDFIYGCSINGSNASNAVVIDNSVATWAPQSTIGMPFMFYPSADGAGIPTDTRLFGLADTRKFFGGLSFRDNLTLDDNLTFSATGKKISGDFTNSTHSNRVMFQTSTSNSGTFVGALPSGSGTQSGFLFYSGNDPDNASYGRLFANGTFGTILDSNKTGTGTAAPLYLNTSGNVGVTVDAFSSTPNVVVGTASAVSTSATNGFLYIPTCAGTPSGTPSAYTGKSPVVVDSTNHVLYYYDGSWRSAAGAAAAPFADSTALVKGSADNTKQLRFEIDGFTTATTRVVTVPDASFIMVGEDTLQTLTNKTINSSNNTVIVPVSDLDDSTANVTFSQSTFNTTFTHSTGLFAFAWTGNTSTNSMFKVSSTNTSATGYLVDIIADSTSSVVKPIRIQAKQTTVLDTNAFGDFTFSPKLQTSGTPTNFTFTGAAHTGLTAGADITDVNFNLARSVQRAAGSVGLDRAVRFQGRTLAFVSASTVTDAINVDIETVSAGTNATITRSTGLRVKPSATTHHGLWVDGPISYVGDAGAFGFAGGKIVRFVGNNGTMNSVFNDNGTLGSSATDGFQYISRIDSGTNPSGTPTAYNGSSPIVLQSDTTGGNYRIHSYLNSAWRVFPSTTSTDTLTNKTISGANNTLAAIPVTALNNLNGFTDAAPALNDVVPIYDTSAGGNRDTTVAELVGVGSEGCIGGLRLEYVDSNTVQVTSGYAYIQSTGKILKSTSTLDIGNPSLSNSTWYHIYFYDNSGTPAIEHSTTAPDTPWIGSARSKTSDTTKRYLGSFKTNGSGAIYNFYHNLQSGYVQWLEDTTASPFRVGASLTATTETAVDCSSVVPSTSRQIQLRTINTSTPTGNVFVRAATGGNNTLTVRINADLISPMTVNTSQNFYYLYNVSPSGAFFADVAGYFLER